MQLIEKILPSEANNKYLGNRIALFGLIFTTCLMTWRSCVHLLYQDGGLNSIGSIIIFDGIPDPNQVIYMLGSVWGLQQLIFCLVNIVVLFRYRNLIPLMYILWLLEWLARPLVVGFLHPLDEQYFTGTTPGIVVVPFAVGFLTLMLILSLKSSKH
ncbi:MAG: hypothetical protein RPS99_03175 [Gammaproteobacteria bacterium]|jgi:hypothetical protein